ncbi:hypothetical protein R6Z07F_014524 [Ovis aries]
MTRKRKKGDGTPKTVPRPGYGGFGAGSNEALCRVSVTHGFGLTTPVKWLFSTSPESRTKTPHRQLFSLDIRKWINFLLKNFTRLPWWHLPVQGTQVRSLIQADSTCHPWGNEAHAPPLLSQHAAAPAPMCCSY